MWQYRYTVLLLCMVAFFATMAARLAISPVVPLIVTDFAVSNALVGLALSGMWLAYALSQFPSGIITDRLGEKIVILFAVGGSALGVVLLATVPFFGLFVICTFFIGLMAGLHYTPATVLLNRLFDNVGTAIGVHTLGGPLAGLLTPIAVVWIGFRYGWRPAVGVATVIAVPVFLLVLWQIRPTPPNNPQKSMGATLRPELLISFLTRPEIAFTITMMIIGTFVWQGLASFLPSFIIHHHSQSAAVAGLAFSGYFVVLGSGNVVVGILADRYGRDYTIGLCMILGMIGFFQIVNGSSYLAIATGVVLIGIGASSYPAMLARLMDSLPSSDPGTGLGLVRTVVGILGASGSFAVGAMADFLSWEVSFLTLGLMLFFVLVLVLLNRIFKLDY